MTDKPTPTDAELFEVIREAARGGAVRRDGSTSLCIARAVLAKWGQPAQAAEPFGWTHKSWIDEANRGRNGVFIATEMVGFNIPIYTTQQPTQTQAVPLTQAQIIEAFCREPHVTQFVMAFNSGVRFAEQHHGIKGGQHG